MMTSWLTNPYSIIQQQIANHKNTTKSSNIDTDEILINIYTDFKTQVDTKLVPELTSKYERHLDNKLVRFRGLVSDLIRDEIYNLRFG